MPKSDDQIESDIATFIATSKPKKSRKRKSRPVQTERERLESELMDEDARLRSAYKGGGTPAQIDEQRARQLQARARLAHRIAVDLGHTPLKQGLSYECFRCGRSGRFDTHPEGAIFAEKCG